MVCSSCEKKLAKLAAPDTWKDGSRNTAGGKDGGRVIGENKALTAARSARYSPYASKCSVCKQSLHQQGIYCQTCAYAKGLCSMCGLKVIDTTFYRQSGGGDPDGAAKRRAEAAAQLEKDVKEEAAKREAQAAFAAQQAPALSRLAVQQGASRVPAGSNATQALAQQAASSGLDAVLQTAFLPSPSFAGPKPGYLFGTGSRGSGYYVDREQATLASALAARHAQPAQPATASAASAAAEMANAALPGRLDSVHTRFDPASLASVAAAKSTLVGGTLTSAMGAAGRPLQKGAAEAAGGPPVGWAYDASSGYYYSADVGQQQYFDPRSQLYFDCATQLWSATPKHGAAADAPKARKVDRWGL